jgi:hypothetical protein
VYNRASLFLLLSESGLGKYVSDAETETELGWCRVPRKLLIQSTRTLTAPPPPETIRMGSPLDLRHLNTDPPLLDGTCRV